MSKASSGQSLINVGLSYLALALNFFEQIGLISSKFSLLPNFFIESVGKGALAFAGFLSLILSGVVVAILWFGFSTGLVVDYRGFVIKKGKIYSEDWVIPYFWTTLLLIIIEASLISVYVSVGLGAISQYPVWLQFSIQLLVYILFWSLLTYFFSYFLKNHVDKSKYEEGRRQYTYDLFETIERSNAIRTDSKFSVVGIFIIHLADRLNFIIARNKYYLVKTSYNASELKFVLEVSKAEFEKELKNLSVGGVYPAGSISPTSPSPSPSVNLGNQS